MDGGGSGSSSSSSCVPGSESWELVAPDGRVFSSVDTRTHVRNNLAMYVGAVDATIHPNSPGLAEDGSIVSNKDLFYSHGMVTAVMEIVSNAIDGLSSASDEIIVEIDADTGRIRVTNTGVGIPIIKAPDGRWLAEHLMSKLNTSENYSSDNWSIGKHGVGSKVCNLASTRFRISLNGGQYVQEWSAYATAGDPPIVSPVAAAAAASTASSSLDAEGSGNKKSKRKRRQWGKTSAGKRVDLEFDLDYSLFGGWSRGQYEAIYVACLQAACARQPGTTFILNGTPIADRGAAYLLKLMHPSVDPAHIMASDHIAVGDNKELRGNTGDRPLMEMALLYTGRASGAMVVYGFINGTRTNKGPHVDDVKNALIKAVEDVVHKSLSREQRAVLKKDKVRSLFKGCVLCVMACFKAPAWSSQDKCEYAGSVPVIRIPASLVAQVMERLSIMERVTTSIDRTLNRSALSIAASSSLSPPSSSSSASLPGSGGSSSFAADPVMISKYLPAQRMRHPKSVLILTEGDSARMLAMSAHRALREREFFGIFPVRGKIPSIGKLISQPAEHKVTVQTILHVLGVKRNAKNPRVSDLNYSSIWVFADQDPDGEHILGLLLALIYTLLHSVVVEKPDFVVRFATPIMVARNTRTDVQHWFNTEEHFKEWMASQANKAQWNVRWKKGLAAWTSAEGQSFFSAPERHLNPIVYTGQDTDLLIKRVFGKEQEHADWRKEWISATDGVQQLRYDGGRVPAPDVFNHSVRYYSRMTCFERALPGPDGLKPCLRQIMYVMLTNNMYDFAVAGRPGVPDKVTGPIKTEELACMIIKGVSYKHGASSLEEAISKLPCDYPGTNNLPLLEPHGMFPTFLFDNTAHARYTATCLTPIPGILFDSRAVHLLPRRDGNVEPIFVPIYPPVLANGVFGIATGFMTQGLPRSVEHGVCVLDSVLERMQLMGSSTDIDWSEYRGKIAVDFGPAFTGRVSLLSVADDGVETWEFHADYQVWESRLEVRQILPGMWRGRQVFDLHTWRTKLNEHLVRGILWSVERIGVGEDGECLCVTAVKGADSTAVIKLLTGIINGNKTGAGDSGRISVAGDCRFRIKGATRQLEKDVRKQCLIGGNKHLFIKSFETTDTDGNPGAIIELDMDVVASLPSGMDTVLRDLELCAEFRDSSCHFVDWRDRITKCLSPATQLEQLIRPRLALYWLRLHNDRMNAAAALHKCRATRSAFEVMSGMPLVMGRVVSALREGGVKPLDPDAPAAVPLRDFTTHVDEIWETIGDLGNKHGLLHEYMRNEVARHQDSPRASYSFALSIDLEKWETGNMADMYAKEERLERRLIQCCEDTPLSVWRRELKSLLESMMETRERFNQLQCFRTAADGARSAAAVAAAAVDGGGAKPKGSKGKRKRAAGL